MPHPRQPVGRGDGLPFCSLVVQEVLFFSTPSAERRGNGNNAAILVASGVTLKKRCLHRNSVIALVFMMAFSDSCRADQTSKVPRRCRQGAGRFLLVGLLHSPTRITHGMATGLAALALATRCRHFAETAKLLEW